MAETMWAAVYVGDQRVEIQAHPRPTIGADDVLVEVSHCGVCGSDLHFVLEGWGQPGSIEGHEYSGRIVAVGDEVTGWQIGDRAVGGPDPKCGTCEACRAGRPSLCAGRAAVGEGPRHQGAFAEFICVPATQLVAIPDGLSLRHAALAEPLAVALHGLTRSGVRAGHRVLITGGGPIGSLSVAALIARGITDIVVSEPSPKRRELCARLGARVVEPGDLSAPRSPNELVDEPFDVALECSGNSSAMEAALGQLARGGTLVLIGAGMAPPRFDPNRILLNELVITGAFCYDPGGFDTALALLAHRDFPTDLLVEPDDVGLEGLGPVIAALGAGEVPAKVLIAPAASKEPTPGGDR